MSSELWREGRDCFPNRIKSPGIANELMKYLYKLISHCKMFETHAPVRPSLAIEITHLPHCPHRQVTKTPLPATSSK